MIINTPNYFQALGILASNPITTMLISVNVLQSIEVKILFISQIIIIYQLIQFIISIDMFL